MESREYIGYVAFASAILFSWFPAQFISGNSEELARPWSILISFTGVGIAIILAAWLSSKIFSPSLKKLIAIVLVAYTVSVFIADIIFPLSIGEIETGKERAAFDALGAGAQAAIFALLAVALWKAPPNDAVPLAWAGVGLFTLGGVAAVAYSQSLSLASAGETAATKSTRGPNIYHVVFDGYHGPWLQLGLNELSMASEVFAGFTHYRSAMANALPTKIAFPTFLSGTLYSQDIKISEWLERADKDNLISDLNKAGYQTSVYAIRARKGFKAAQKYVEYDAVPPTLIADYWLLRILPVAARPLALKDGAGFASTVAVWLDLGPSGDLRTYHSYQQFLKFLEDEASRPSHGQYVLIHVYPPHPPYQLDRNGKYVGESNYREQLLLATNAMQSSVKRLKELGKFDESFIILQSDHGSLEALEPADDKSRKYSRRRIDDATSTAIAEDNVTGLSGIKLETIHSALLLTKPPAGCSDEGSHNLVVDDRLVELKALRSFIANVREGKSCSYPEVTSVEVITGLAKQKAGGKSKYVGPDLKQGVVSHYRVDKDFQWHILDPIPFVY